ncbi:SRPBCC domain-containing protein [Clostridium sp. C8-1-8]|uniref:SRPBCC domain-containing protein n=1 Tax=Clostridium sp. C8-1-8 TaxID=2698831 RepID=UPI001370D531|nr:SRPBCC domain-containing protein [Clostridium sp. C8-1-8]
MEKREVVNVKVTVNKPVEKVWRCWTEPKHIKKWNKASEDWHTTVAENDLKVGGKFLSRMEAKDGSMGFDFWGIYDEVKKHELLEYTLGDERKVKVIFKDEGEKTLIDQYFEAESENPIEMQQAGWQSILNNFKEYAEKV